MGKDNPGVPKNNWIKSVLGVVFAPLVWIWGGLTRAWHWLNMPLPIKVVIVAGLLSGVFLLGNTYFNHFLSNMKKSEGAGSIKKDKLVHLEAEGNSNDQFALNNDSGYVTVNNYWAENPKLNTDVTSLQSAVKDAGEKIEKLQQSQNMDEIVKAIFERMKVEQIKPLEDGKMFVVKKDDRFAYVLFVLDFVPIPNTVELQYYIYSQPPGSYSTFNNVILFNWSDAVSKLETKQFSVRYIADYSRSSEKTEVFIKDGYLVAKDKIAFRLSDGMPFNIVKKTEAK